MKTSELTGPALDWAVAKCMTGEELFQCGKVAHAVVLHSVEGTMAPYFVKDSGVVRCVFDPATNWAQGGPIIDREGITVSKTSHGFWEAYFRTHDERESYQTDPTPLIAAMRCYVASKLGEEVEVPDELA